VNPAANADPDPPPRGRLRARLTASFAIVLCSAGCAGNRTPPRPAALEEGGRLARQAAELQAEGRWNRAAIRWEDAGRQFQLLNQLEAVAIARHNEAVCRDQMGQSEAAHQLLEHAAILNQQLGETTAWWRNQVALLQIENASDPARASQRLEQLRARSAPAGDPLLEALLAQETARNHLFHGDTDEAWSRAQQALAIFERLGDPAGIAAVNATTARILAARGQFAEAEGIWRIALDQYEALADPKGVAVSLAGLAMSLVAQGGDLGNAKVLLRRALQNLRTLGLEDEAAEVEAQFEELENSSVGN
jgi:tetratricopeptide (TPR) repeat protein